MKNADMPAMPIIDDEQSFPIDGEKYGKSLSSGRFAVGMTKREMIAMHICSAITGSIHDEECYLRIKAMSDRCGVKVSEWIARDAVKQADALLAELGRECQKS